MQLHEIENWALQIIDAVNDGRPNEDSRVELKSDWPTDIDKAARQIAGHANASGGSSILWLMGVDEVSGVVGVARNDVATWYPQIASKVDGLAPELTDINVPTAGKTVVALCFETNRRPFVVKNPKYGQRDGGPVALEVPWREGTRTRTAKRDDLIRLLSPLQVLPEFEILSATLSCAERDDLQEWDLSASLYAVTDGRQQIVIPYHRCSASATVPHDNKVTFASINMHPPFTGMREIRNASVTIESGPDEIILFGPGKIILRADAKLEPVSFTDSQNCSANIQLFPALSEQPVSLSFSLEPTKIEPGGNLKARWELVSTLD